MSALEAIRADVIALRDTLAGINARRSQIDPEIADHEQQIAALREERVRCLHDSEQAALAIRRLERAEALLNEHAEPIIEPQEQLPLAPEPVAATPKPPAPTAGRARIRSELDEMSRARHEADAAETPVTIPARRQPRGGDPLKVLSRSGHSRTGTPGVTRLTIEDGGYENVDIANLTPTDAARAELVRQLLTCGEASGMELQEALMSELSCDHPGTAQTIVGRCLSILYRQGRAEPTGEKAPGTDGKLRSPIWKLTEES